ncbi:ABC transporter substrate-binding protein [Desulforhopalus singaporensis]|uniref:Putative ABC transport system substrate-binding protein n=1 Tax=Desulforhopalus singaporensis TaxID=91360 RepID=A0A1H0UGS8_9BACT|nr:ABC transporter substrate-binding protein [Desulforhopalus singaporensis]SDP65333.1 putative ABC transport system substrate-binding protein [Desulforhopalus singaporensis]
MKKLSLSLVAAFFFLMQAIAGYSATISVSQFVEHPALDAVLKGFQDYLRDKGVEVTYKVHNAQANMGTATQIAQQMVGEKADIMMAIATPSAQTCAQALSKAPEDLKRPLLFTAVTDPVAAGLVKDLNKPGGGITGVSDLLPVEEHIKMVLSYSDRIKTLGLLYNAGEANSKAIIGEINQLRDKLGFQTVEATAAKTADVYQAAKSLVGRADAVFIPTDNTIISALESVLKVGVQNKLPIFAADVDSVKRGAVAAMGFDYYKHGYQTGAVAEKILNGTRPEDIPVQFQEELQLHINVPFSKQMGLTPPQALLNKATKIYQ